MAGDATRHTLLRMTDIAAINPLRIVIAGGGVAAIETLLALGSRPRATPLDVTVLASGEHLTYRPLAVTEPFGRPPARRYALAEICADAGARLLPDTLAKVEPDRHRVVTGSGERIAYDALVVATGARARRSLQTAHVFTADRADDLRWLLRDVEAGATRRIAFVVPPGAGWALPLYELALMTAARAREVGVEDLALTLVTPEDTPLAAFTGAGSAAVAELLRAAGITVETSSYVREEEPRALVLAPGDRRVPFDEVVALPRLIGPGIDGLPCDPDGFVFADEHGHVPGLDSVYAIGDATTFPIKQGGIATQQADAVAAAIGAERGTATATTRPLLRAILFTGEAPLYLRATLAGGQSVTSSASRECPWWPPQKIAARHLAPYLADRAEIPRAAAA